MSPLAGAKHTYVTQTIVNFLHFSTVWSFYCDISFDSVTNLSALKLLKVTAHDLALKNQKALFLVAVDLALLC